MTEGAGGIDVLVAGAGPAGAAAARRLALRGLSVLACDRATFPRDKLCGEFLSPDTVAGLLDLGVGDAAEAAPVLDRFVLSVSGGAVLERPLLRPGRGLRRRTLDAALADGARQAGADVREACRVVDLRARAGRSGPPFTATLERGGRRETVDARAVIDATGKLGLAARGPRTRPRFVGLKRHFTGRGASRGGVEIHAFHGGYCGLADVDGALVNACLLARADRVRDAGSADRLLRSAAAENPVLGRRLEELRPAGAGWLSTAVRSFGGLPPARGPVRVGDAAALIAPLCGDGLGMALRSAVLADRAVAAFLTGEASWASCLAAYRDAWRRELSGRLVLGRAVQAVVLRPSLARPAHAVLRALPALVDGLVRSTRDWSRTPEPTS